MKSVIVPAPGKIEIREVETPVINAYQALVKTEMVALCNATDSKLIAGHFPGVDTYPLALGHENAGIVVAVGEKVRNFKVGDRAIGGLISDFGAQGINSGWGGFSEYVVVNDFEVLKEEEKKLLSTFETQLRHLMYLHDELKRENAGLRKLLENEKLKNEKVQAQYDELEVNYTNLKTATAISLNGSDVKETKLRLSKLVREVDKCIALLNE